MPIHPAAAPILEMMKQLPSATAPFSVEAFRFGDDQPLPFPKAEVAEIRDLSLGGSPARLYHPRPGERLPVLMFLHGGGWVCGNIETHDGLCRALAAKAECAVVSVDYPRAPDSRFHEPLEASYRALTALSGARLAIDAERLAVAGDSAGGNLAAALCLLARARGGPKIAHQLLLYPVMDADFTRESYAANGADYFLTTDMMRWFWEQYLGDAATSPAALAAPLRAEDLAGLPPATIVTAEFDPLRDEGEAYAARLEAAGVPVRLERVAGVFHGFASMSGVLPHADEALNLAADELRRALA
jgi:acetyl esterase